MLLHALESLAKVLFLTTLRPENTIKQVTRKGDFGVNQEGSYCGGDWRKKAHSLLGEKNEKLWGWGHNTNQNQLNPSCNTSMKRLVCFNIGRHTAAYSCNWEKRWQGRSCPTVTHNWSKVSSLIQRGLLFFLLVVLGLGLVGNWSHKNKIK